MPSRTSKPNKTARLDYERPECYPFVKWAGGKTQLLHHLDKFIPQDVNCYFEPFVGGGAFFFYLTLKRDYKLSSVLSDINQELINAYKVIKNNVEELIIVLRIF